MHPLARQITIYLLVVALSLAPWSAWAQSARKIQPNDLSRPSGEWLMHGRDYSETYFSPLKQIDAANVKRLGLAWHYDGDAATGQLEATPLVANGTVYGTLTWNVIFALDARTGKLKWRWDPEIPRQQFKLDPNGVRVRVGPSFCCGAVNRGAAYHEGKIYSGLLDGSLVALDAETGKVAWRVQTTNKEDDYSITGAPRVIKGKVIVGNSGAEYGVRGYVSAYDAQSGKLLWRFYTVPGDPSQPFESKALEVAAKTWNGPYWKYGAGGTAWDGMAYDPEADLLYIGTGNGSPWPRDLRSPGGGDNLYLASILAIRPDTGEYVWHFQTTPADNWDYAATQPLILTDLNISGRQRKVLMQAPKNGFFYVLDRITGEFISAQPFARVTWAKGVDPKTGRPIETPEANYGAEGVTISPGSDGAHNWHSMSWNPDTGLVYVPGQETSGVFAKDMNFQYQLGRLNLGRKRTAGRSSAVEAAPTGPQATNEMVVGLGRQQEGGFLVAWDPVTQKERWRIRSEVPGVSGGTVTTAGNLVFHGGADGMFRAYSADIGEKLWEMKLAPGFANPVTYMLDGKQYVSVLSGRGGMQAPGRMYTFVLDGKAGLPSMEPAAPAIRRNPSANDQMPTRTQVAANAQESSELPDAPEKNLVQRVCVTCHPATSLTRNRMPLSAWRQTVKEMVGRGAQATPAELEQIVEYLTRHLGPVSP